jgi:CoA:oxalate CoA-transferase
MKSPLEDIRVIDLTHVWFGPWCTMMLAEMGAEVIKVEPPWGALGRIEEFGTMYGGAAPTFHHLNLNKKDLAINTRTPEGLKLMQELIKKSDVIINNFAPGTMEKMSLSYEDCVKLRPNIIFAQLSGFGDSGPYREYSSYAVIAEAFAGWARAQGDRDDPNGPPKSLVGALGDTAPGTMAAMAILAALRYRDKTGEGQKIDVAQYDCMFGYNTSTTNYWLSGKTEAERRVEDEERRKQRQQDPLSQISGYIKVKDGYIMTTGLRAKAFDALKAKFGVEELTKEMVMKEVENMTREEAFHYFAKLGFPTAIVYYASESTKDPHINAREMITSVDHPLLGKIKAINFPVKMSKTPGKVLSAAPLLGQHQRDVIIGLLGYSQEEFDKLVQGGIIAYQPDIDKQLENWKKSP